MHFTFLYFYNSNNNFIRSKKYVIFCYPYWGAKYNFVLIYFIKVDIKIIRKVSESSGVTATRAQERFRVSVNFEI